jgi:hypothetical protein
MQEVCFMKEQLAQYVGQIGSSVIALEVLAYFHHNPSAMDTSRGLAHWIGRNPELLESVLEQMTATGLLQCSASDNPVFRYTRDRDARELVGEFLAQLLDSDGRLRLARLLEFNGRK